MPDILDEEHPGVDDALYSTQPLAASWKSPKAVAKQLELFSERLEHPNVAFFSKYDSLTSSFHYGYAKLEFTSAIEEEARGEFQYVVHSVTNSKGKIQRLNIARIPKGAMARASYLKWMGISERLPAISGKTVEGVDQVASSCSVPKETVCNEAYFMDEDGTIYVWQQCYEVCPVGGWPTTEPPPPNSGGEPNECWVVGVCMPNGGIRTMPTLTDCAGIIGGSAEMDGCNRCVGGTTGRLPAEPPMCNVVPCSGDPLRKMEITSPGKSGLNGGRFRIGSAAVRKYNDGRPRPHYGMDLSCSVGDPLFAIYPGTVHSLDPTHATGGYGNRVSVRVSINGQTRYYSYNHLNAFSVQPGQNIGLGTVLGHCGRTGYSDDGVTTHVHIEYSTGGEFMNASKLDPEQLLTTKYDALGNALNQNPCNQ